MHDYILERRCIFIFLNTPIRLESLILHGYIMGNGEQLWANCNF